MKARRLPARGHIVAGVALVDILANGLAMLIIVIVLSIASRAEREERTSAQVEEVETMMSRRFSTSLVLNSLAASPPARLHDYRNSPLDQIHDPHLLPIIELHRNFVREFYTGAVWRRAELLREPNAMDAWLDGFDEERKKRLRTDVYDIAQFYLTMSILRDHGVVARHWHFPYAGGLGLAQASRCPPGVAAEDCQSGDGDGVAVLPSLTPGGGAGAGGDNETWPPPGFFGEGGEGAGGGKSDNPQFPGGAALGAGGGGLGGDPGGGLGSAGGLAGGGRGYAGSFPNARPGQGGSRGLLGADGQGQSGAQTRFRLSSPESLRQGLTGEWGQSAPTPEQVLAVLLDFLGKLQGTLDAGASPSAQLENFEQLIRHALGSPPVLHGAARKLLDDLIKELARPAEPPPNATADQSVSALLGQLQDWAGAAGSAQFRKRPLDVTPLEFGARADTALMVETNRRLRRVVVGRSAQAGEAQLPNAARPVLRLNAHPDIWRGLSLSLERNGILLMPPAPQHPEQVRWRALAYVAPEFDDFIIGFAYAAVDADGWLVAPVEDNHVRLDGRPLRNPYHEASFGARSWLVALYAGLVLSLFGLVLMVRRLGAEPAVTRPQRAHNALLTRS